MTVDESYMDMALELAKRGMGAVNPNPLVGAVIVKDEKVIGKGWHERFGGLHAERNALADCKESTEGATIYVTLEPCCHYGKTPPCTEAILASGIRRVVIGSSDPNPLVAGKGIRILQEAGLTVETGVLKKECDALNAVFFITSNKKTVCGDEIRNDTRWKDRDSNGRFEVDHRGRRKGKCAKGS